MQHDRSLFNYHQSEPAQLSGMDSFAASHAKLLTAFARQFLAARRRLFVLAASAECRPTVRVVRFSTTKYGKFLSVDPSKFSPPNVSIYNSVHVATRTQIPHKQSTLLKF